MISKIARTIILTPLLLMVWPFCVLGGIVILLFLLAKMSTTWLFKGYFIPTTRWDIAWNKDDMNYALGLFIMPYTVIKKIWRKK